MAKQRPINLKETKGMFKAKGFVKGIERENTYKELTTKSNKAMRILNLPIEVAPNQQTMVTIQGMEQNEAFFYKRPENKGEEGDVKRVPFEDRFEDQGEGYQLIGVNLGLRRDDKGKNVVESFHQYDGADEAYKLLEDGNGVFVKGQIEFNKFQNKDGDTITTQKLNVQSMYNSDKVDFEEEGFEPESDFDMTVVFMGIEQDPEDKERFLIEAKSVGYQDIFNVELVTYDKKLAGTMRKNLKPYNAIRLFGEILNKVEVEEVESEDVWGQQSKFDKPKYNFERELRVIGADGGSVDTESYSEEAFEEAVKALSKVGEQKPAKNKEEESDNDAWGASSSGIEEDDLPW